MIYNTHLLESHPFPNLSPNPNPTQKNTIVTSKERFYQKLLNFKISNNFNTSQEISPTFGKYSTSSSKAIILLNL
jgi:hypothetical protein